MDTATRSVLSAHLRLLREGHRSSFRGAFELLWPALLSFARRFGLTQADAEDVAQRSLLCIFSQIEDYNPNYDGLTWAFALTFCEVRTLRRQQFRRREQSFDSAASVFYHTEDGLLAALRREMWNNIEIALGSLSASDREAVLATITPSNAIHPTDAAHRKRRQRALDRLRGLVMRLYSFD